jgi:hypothetical protein
MVDFLVHRNDHFILSGLKRVVLNRKNSRFVGNPRGGRTAAILASLTSSCRRHEMDPQLYFMQLLTNLPWWSQIVPDS